MCKAVKSFVIHSLVWETSLTRKFFIFKWVPSGSSQMGLNSFPIQFILIVIFCKQSVIFYTNVSYIDICLTYSYSRLLIITSLYKNKSVCRHSSMDSSAPTILPPRVQVPSTPSFRVKFVLYLPCEKNKNRAGDGPFKKHLRCNG